MSRHQDIKPPIPVDPEYSRDATLPRYLLPTTSETLSGALPLGALVSRFLDCAMPSPLKKRWPNPLCPKAPPIRSPEGGIEEKCNAYAGTLLTI